MTESRRRGPLSFKRRSIESLPDEDVPLGAIDAKVNAPAAHKAEVAEQNVGDPHPRGDRFANAK